MTLAEDRCGDSRIFGTSTLSGHNEKPSTPETDEQLRNRIVIAVRGIQGEDLTKLAKKIGIIRTGEQFDQLKPALQRILEEDF